MSTTDTPISHKKPRFLGIFLVTSLIGVLLISFSVYRASLELEVVHEVDNMHRLIPAMLGEPALTRIARGEHPLAPGEARLPGDPAYRFFVISDGGLRPLQSGSAADLRLLESIDLESTRVNERGGYFEADGAIRTWVKFPNRDNTRTLLVVHRFSSAGAGALAHVYQQRMIIPVAFYLWLTVWVSLILNHLLRELHAQKDQLQQMALHDALTGLPNRKLMQDRLSKLILASRRDGQQFAFGVIDLNGFKKVNDTHGHFYGDELLRQAAKRIEGALRAADTAARFGGDEFTVLLSPADWATCLTVLDRIQAALNAPYILSDTQVTVSASIGVAIFPVHGKDADTLLFNADLAMYAAKAKGGGISVFEPGAAGQSKDASASIARAGGGASAYTN
ncbi:diguanylate cyclase [Sulfuricaulis limicola]|uniref:Diguanylate cyclase n=1 Tax=Sulfuricaulis limicola TaxID=1620215 RepID=A0A1B4XG06_9GAMM|nr:GGDEF domain-containing protein [Sulfuricaulis limicola]BAV33764.1 diguanylate cyclase [Sulfuricaulis limicola]